ncbi:PREDICTED: protein phosphatase 1 regulatory subunit 14D [Gekko japonicus]|uniref:Protein phosphatase 1 regulatory subunit 14D n=1 Tax=Gekko japonicus TaxID=146911 RepID=A0ABM1KAS2_GEKJA|nr:PREDICTED: protein phosphatase 1 regulatory subunit 14D [Gekko japonicus]
MVEERTLSPETTEEVERLVSLAQGSGALPRVTFNTPEKLEEESCHRKLAKLTTKYNRKDLQRWRDLEEWIDAQLQELYQYQCEYYQAYQRQCEYYQAYQRQFQEETEATAAPEPEIDIEDLLEVSNEEQKSRLQEILHKCSRPTEDFVAELVDRLRGLRKIANPQRK